MLLNWGGGKDFLQTFKENPAPFIYIDTCTKEVIPLSPAFLFGPSPMDPAGPSYLAWYLLNLLQHLTLFKMILLIKMNYEPAALQNKATHQPLLLLYFCRKTFA